MDLPPLLFPSVAPRHPEAAPTDALFDGGRSKLEVELPGLAALSMEILPLGQEDALKGELSDTGRSRILTREEVAKIYNMVTGATDAALKLYLKWLEHEQYWRPRKDGYNLWLEHTRNQLMTLVKFVQEDRRENAELERSINENEAVVSEITAAKNERASLDGTARALMSRMEGEQQNVDDAQAVLDQRKRELAQSKRELTATQRQIATLQRGARPRGFKNERIRAKIKVLLEEKAARNKMLKAYRWSWAAPPPGSIPEEPGVDITRQRIARLWAIDVEEIYG